MNRPDSQVRAKFEQLLHQGELAEAGTFLQAQPFSSPPSGWGARNYFLLGFATAGAGRNTQLLFDALLEKGFGKPRHAAQALKHLWTHSFRAARLIDKLLPALLPHASTLKPDLAQSLLVLASVKAPHHCKALVQAGVPVDSLSRQGWTPLHEVVLKSEGVEATRLLLDLGANPNVQDPQGRIPLNDTWDCEVAHALLDHGADPHVRNDEGHTTFMQWGNMLIHSPETVALLGRLLDLGVDPHAKTPQGETLWQVCESEQSHEILREVIARHQAQCLERQTQAATSLPRPRL